MLVLTRKYQEKIRIGDNITITVLRTKGKAVRLGIEAPADVPVIRGELAFQHSPETENSAGQRMQDENGSSDAADKPAREPRSSARPDWSTKSPLHTTDLSRDSQSVGQVELKRVPRAKVGELLPKLVSGSPLRAMMDQR